MTSNSTATAWSEIVDEEERNEALQATAADGSSEAGGTGGSAGGAGGGGGGEGIKTVTEHKKNEAGKHVKVTKKIKVYKNLREINKRVEERRQKWNKFGKCSGVDGIEPGVTSLCDEVQLVLGEERKIKQQMQEEKQDEEEIKRMYATLMTTPAVVPPSGKAGSPPTETGPVVWRPKFDRGQASKTGGGGGQTTTQRAAPKEGTYVAPRLRGGGPPQDDEATIRVTNLSEDITEEDLKGLFRPFGDISRIYLAKDKQTQRSKGFAFINFKSKSSAQTAMDALNGKGFEYLILNIEWAKPSTQH